MSLRDYLRRRKAESVELTEVEVSWLGIKGKWIADCKQQTTAWEIGRGSGSASLVPGP
jgi:hypothetical protein